MITKTIDFNEFELLTLREGLFKIKDNGEILSLREFFNIDKKIKLMLQSIAYEK